tara:strand:- start:3413 stop:5071 length:1659 start_codon:yes stop_codon:yes gene_type:complete
MAITVQKLSELTDAEVEAAHNAIVQLVKENNPSVDVKRGVIHDLVVHMSALLGAAKDKEIERLRRSMSIKTILEDPALSDTDIVDAVLSNYRITRGASAAATGDVTIIVNKQSALTLPANTLFTVGGTTFSLASGGVSVRTSSAQVTAASDRVLEPVQNGLYAFSVPVVASSAGLIADVKRGNTVIVSPTPLHFSSAHASNDFTSGTNAETNAELMVRFQEGIAAQAWSNRTNITSMIKSNATFSSVSDTSIIGMSDAEMVRDQHSILPISLGGRTDIYVRSAQTLATTTKQITATFVEEITNSTTGACVGGKWQFGLGRTEIPGFYEVTRAALTTAAATDTGYEAVSIVRDFDLGDDDFIPDINTAKEAAFSKYQTAIVQILDTDTDVSSAVAGSTQQSYDITFSHMPLIAELQDFCGGRDVRNPAGDVLVKGAIPCFLSLNFTVRKSATEAAPNLDAIREALAIEVNSLGFSGHLHASRISDLVFGYLSSTSAVSNIDMFGRILSPEGSNIYIRSGDVLEIPNRTDDFVSPRTVVFILERNDIGITVENM